MSLEPPTKATLNVAPTVDEYKAAIGALYDFILSGFYDPITGGGTANAQTATLGETGGYKTNRIYAFIPGTTNTAACTVNFDLLGAKNVKLINGSNPYVGALTSGVTAFLRYDGTNLVLLNPASQTGQVLQTAFAEKTALESISSTSFVNISSLAATFPNPLSNTNSRVLLIATIGYNRTGGDGISSFRFNLNSNSILPPGPSSLADVIYDTTSKRSISFSQVYTPADISAGPFQVACSVNSAANPIRISAGNLSTLLIQEISG